MVNLEIYLHTLLCHFGLVIEIYIFIEIYLVTIIFLHSVDICFLKYILLIIFRNKNGSKDLAFQKMYVFLTIGIIYTLLLFNLSLL